MKKILSFACLLFLFISSASYGAGIVNDFDLGNPVEDLSGAGHIGIQNNICNSGYESDCGGVWKYESDHTNGDDPQTATLQTDAGICFDTACLQIDIGTSATSCDGLGTGNYYLYAYSAFNSKPIMDQAADADQLTFYINLPSGYPETNNYNLHVGTYTKDPAAPDSDNGNHYYHWFDLKGSYYWTKVIVNQHPQNEVGVETPPGNNPETWDYLSNLYRFYVDGVPCSPIGEYTMYIDEIQFETLAEANDDDNINSVSIGYAGNGNFRMQWYKESHVAEFSGEVYELRWSLSPITNANFSSATLVSDSITRNTSSANDEFEIEFNIAVTSGTVYFAIYDSTVDNGVVSKYDYQIKLLFIHRAGGSGLGAISSSR